MRKEQESLLSPFLEELRARRDELGITDVQMGLTTLEEVFLSIAKDAERLAALADNKSCTLAVTIEGRVFNVVVPWGCDAVQLPTTGEIVKVAWAQDDEGRLVYNYHEFRGVREVNVVTDHGKGCLPCC